MDPHVRPDLGRRAASASQRPAPRRAIALRELGLQRIATTNRWLIAGAIGLSGFFSAVAALARPGASHRPSAAAGSAASSGPANSASDPSAQSANSGGSAGVDPSQQIQAPDSTPQVDQVPSAPAPVVSGGS